MEGSVVNGSSALVIPFVPGQCCLENWQRKWIGI